MQTLKTAIVVLLMMTVMYGCYVSLTTAPESLPGHVAELIDESGTFGDLAIDAGLPESLASLGIADSSPYGVAEPAKSQLDDGPAELTFSDGPASSVISGDLGNPAAVAMTDSLSERDLAARQLPRPSERSAAVLPDIGRDYPSTETAELNLPDPKSFGVLPPNWQGENQKASWDAIANNDSIGSPGTVQRELTSAATPNIGLANALRTADRQYAADQPAEALATLSLFYNTPGMTADQRTALLGRLDPLAATVIYSRKHLLEQPHRVGQAETLMEIAARYELPWQLLANINAIDDPVTVLPGTELKVVRGPFRAEVDLSRNELTIFLGDLYAGRFPISVGSDPAPQEGTYTVQDKQSARTFYDRNGSPVPAGDARNPYGNVWLDLGKQLCIHGSPDRSEPSDQGCISLRGADAEDLYGILTQGSSVTIRR